MHDVITFSPWPRASITRASRGKDPNLASDTGTRTAPAALEEPLQTGLARGEARWREV